MDAEMSNHTDAKIESHQETEQIDTGTSNFKNQDWLLQQDTEKLEDNANINEDSHDDQLFNDDTNYDSRRKSAPAQLKIKTRRQSKGLVYFNRKKPQIEISIGSLEDWYVENQMRFKRRKMNTFTQGVDEQKEEDYFDLEQARSKLNKTYLHENWLEDFEKEKRKLEQNMKKRKRSNSSRSRSKSPTPVSKQAPIQIDFNQNQRVGSVKANSIKESIKGGGSIKQDFTNSSQIDSEEEDRREAEKIKKDILEELNKKDEPMESVQLSTILKYAQKYIEEALQCLLENKLIKKKDVGKKSYYIAANQESYQQFNQQKDQIRQKIQEMRDVEMQEQVIDNELNKLEKQIKELKIKPTSSQIQQEIEAMRKQIRNFEIEIEEFKKQPAYLGDQMLNQQKQMQEKLARIVQIYKKRKDCCEDMLDFFSQHLNEDIESIMRKCGINPSDGVLSDELAEILGIQKQSDNNSSQQEEEEEKPKSKKKRLVKNDDDDDDQDGQNEDN